MKFLMLVLGWLQKLVTGKDNSTPDVIRLGSILLGLQFMLLSGWSVLVQGKEFNPTEFAGGAALLLGGTGLGTKLKPEDEAPQDA